MPGSHHNHSGQKKALVIRLGAWGDMVMASPLFRLLKQDGFYTVANVNPRGAKVLENNPYVDEVMLHPDDCVPNEKLGEHWAKISEGFDRVINLSGSIESGLLKTRDDREYQWTTDRRHETCNVNYYDRTLEVGRFQERGLNGELYFSSEEEKWGGMVRDQHREKFVVLWSLSGSSVHKFYPWAEYVGPKFLEAHSDAVIFTVGEAGCSLIQFNHPRNKKRVGQWDIRRSFVMAKYADLVIGPETGVLNAAGCFETPKVVMLSHSSHENLSKYWKNCIPVEADKTHAPCHPCHKMIYNTNDCITNKVTGLPVCTAHLKPEIVLNAMESVYQKWKERRNGILGGKRQSAVLC